MQRWIVDRLEDGFAVCEALETEARIDVPVAHLPAAVAEGDILVRSAEDGTFTIDAAATEARRNSLRARMDKLLRRK